MDALPANDALTVETHLENLALVASDAERFNAFASGLVESNGRYITTAGACRVHFTIDSFTRVIFVHIIERVPDSVPPT